VPSWKKLAIFETFQQENGLPLDAKGVTKSRKNETTKDMAF